MKGFSFCLITVASAAFIAAMYTALTRSRISGLGSADFATFAGLALLLSIALNTYAAKER